MKVNTDITEVMVSSKDSQEVTIVDCGNIKLKQAHKFKYLRVILRAQIGEIS